MGENGVILRYTDATYPPPVTPTVTATRSPTATATRTPTPTGTGLVGFRTYLPRLLR